MTPEESIEIIEKQIVTCEAMIEFNENFDPEEDNTKFLKEKEALLMAADAIKEVQQYREIGTVEEIKSVKKYIDLKRRCGTPANTIDLCAEYVAIGTVEECREAVDKQKPKKPVLRNDNGKLRKSCPVCGCFFSPLSRSCPKCGQAIDENLEGMEDE